MLIASYGMYPHEGLAVIGSKENPAYGFAMYLSYAREQHVHLAQDLFLGTDCRFVSKAILWSIRNGYTNDQF